MSREPLVVRVLERIVFAPAVGVGIGILVAIFTSLVAWGRMIRGATFHGLGILSDGPLAVWQIFVLYFVGFPLGGMIVGLLWPLHRFEFGAVFLGVLAAFPLYLGVAHATGESMLWGVLPAIVVGGGLGWWWWNHEGPGS